MCQICRDPNRWLLKQSDQTEQEMQTTMEEFAAVLQSWHSSIVEALGTLGIDLASEAAVQVAIEGLLDPYRERWAVVLEDAWTRGADAGRSAAVQEFSLDISWEITDPNTVDALEEHGQQAAEQTQERMTGDISEALVEGYQEGHGIDEISDTLQEDVFPDMQGYETRRVARTEGISSANRGRLSGFQDSSATAKTWMARDDDDTRDSHDEADNQTVPLGETFSVGGHDAMFPGDPSLPVGERANCRCLVLPEFDT